jgi:hypothetical protein
MYAVRSKTGAAFRRSGIAFDAKSYRLLDPSQMTPAIRGEKSLEIVEVTGRDDPKLALHKVLEGEPSPESQVPSESDRRQSAADPDQSKTAGKKPASTDAGTK